MLPVEPPRRPGQPETLDERAARHFYPEPKPAPARQAPKPSGKPHQSATDPKAERLFPKKIDPADAKVAELIRRTRAVSSHLPANADRSFNAAIKESLKATDQQHKEWQRRVRLSMRADYGDEGPRLLAEANTIAKRDPQLRKLLNSSGAGNHPAVIARFVELALSERKAKK